MVFEKLDKIIEVNYSVLTQSTLSIQSIDMPFQVYDTGVVAIGGKPVIPGSSIKGAMRSTLESLMAKHLPPKQICLQDANNPEREKKDEYAGKIGRKRACPAENPCNICKIFGTTGGNRALSGQAIFTDAILKNGEDRTKIIERAHVALRRDNKSQSSGGLMTFQGIDAGVKFDGKVRIINPEDWMVGAIIRGLQTVELLSLGGKKTAGYGEVSVELTSVLRKEFKASGWEGVEMKKEEIDKSISAFNHLLGMEQ